MRERKVEGMAAIDQAQSVPLLRRDWPGTGRNAAIAVATAKPPSACFVLRNSLSADSESVNAGQSGTFDSC